MKSTDIKNNFHQLIDSIDNEGFLSKFYVIMEKAIESKDGMLWNNLSEEEKDELLRIEEECENEMNLISMFSIKEKHKKWL